MPSLAQIKRLSLVLVIPLIILGVYLTDNDYLLETNFHPVCNDVGNRIYCDYMPFNEMYDRYEDQLFVKISSYTPLVSRFAYEVMLRKESFPTMGADFDPHNEEGERFLILEGNAYDPVEIARDYDRDNAWYYRKKGVFLQPFSFVDDKNNKKFVEAFKSALELEKGVKTKNTINLFISYLIPLVSYISLILLGFILMKVGGYVKNGVEK